MSPSEASSFFDSHDPERGGADALRVDLEGYEGPLDVLLSLAQKQKVDLARISILKLVEQYLAFITAMQDLKIDLAADYLVMAAWLTYLKSRLLLPDEPEEDEISAEDMADKLTRRLQHLHMMRHLSDLLMQRPRKGHDVYPCGGQDPMEVEHNIIWTASLNDLVRAYASQRQKDMQGTVRMKTRQVWALQDIKALLKITLGDLSDWVPLYSILENLQKLRNTGPRRDGLLASGFVASLELVREGELSIHQSRAFEPLMIRKALAMDPVE
jgi:segregation and condensation protein A